MIFIFFLLHCRFEALRVRRCFRFGPSFLPALFSIPETLCAFSLRLREATESIINIYGCYCIFSCISPKGQLGLGSSALPIILSPNTAANTLTLAVEERVLFTPICVPPPLHLGIKLSAHPNPLSDEPRCRWKVAGACVWGDSCAKRSERCLYPQQQLRDVPRLSSPGSTLISLTRVSSCFLLLHRA